MQSRVYDDQNSEYDYMFTNDYKLVWADHGSGADTNFSCWAPVPSPGYYILGHYAYYDYEQPDLSMLVVKPIWNPINNPNSPFAYPTGYNQIWNDQGAHSNDDGAFWEPIPPAGYKAMGCMVTASYDPPSTTDMVCVREDLLVPCDVGDLIWGDWGSKGDNDVTLYGIGPDKNLGDRFDTGVNITAGSFCGHASYDPLAQSNVAYALKEKLLPEDLYHAKRIDIPYWMSYLPNRMYLVDLILPGSHDSASNCTARIKDAFGSQTQLDELVDQMRRGVRFFDLRIEKNDGKISFHHGKASGQGANADVAHVFETQLKPFMEQHQGEFFIFDMAINGDEDVFEEVLNVLKNNLNADTWAATEHLLPSGELDPNVMFGVLRGAGRRYIALWDFKGDKSKFTQPLPPWITYTENVRLSPYDEKVYTSPSDPDDFNPQPLIDFLDNQCINRNRTKLLVSQVIVTPHISFDPGEHPADLNKKFFDKLQAWTMKHGCGSNVNIILRDFIDNTPSIVAKVIKMNYDRNQKVIFPCNSALATSSYMAYLRSPFNAYLSIDSPSGDSSWTISIGGSSGNDGYLYLGAQEKSWRLGTQSQFNYGCYAAMQSDGNLVIYDITELSPQNVIVKLAPIWSTATILSGSYLQLDPEKGEASIRDMEGDVVRIF